MFPRSIWNWCLRFWQAPLRFSLRLGETYRVSLADVPKVRFESGGSVSHLKDDSALQLATSNRLLARRLLWLKEWLIAAVVDRSGATNSRHNGPIRGHPCFGEVVRMIACDRLCQIPLA